jgi:D-sedoheptulose 7-phosphate isomerase
MKNSEGRKMESKNLALVRKRIQQSVRVKQRFSDKLLTDVALAAQMIVESYRNGGKLILFGNGGSAADAQHIACELVGRFIKERRPLEAVSLTTNTSTLTSVANDYGYDRVFERQVEAAAKPVDVVVGISTSGDSPGVVRAIKRAKKIGCMTIGMTGQTGGALKRTTDILLNIPSKDTPRIQESHILLGHIICELVERAIHEQKQ